MYRVLDIQISPITYTLGIVRGNDWGKNKGFVD